MAGTLNIPKILKDVACQELLRYEDIKIHGTLRLRGTVNKFMDTIVTRQTSIGFRWPRMYVLLHRGCLYVYKNENSTLPRHASSLFGFTEACVCSSEVASTNVAWPFKVVRELDIEDKSFYFSSPSQLDMQKWITMINEEILFANGGRLVTQTPSRNLQSTPTPLALRPPLPLPCEPPYSDDDSEASEEEGCSSDSSYDQIDGNATDDFKRGRREPPQTSANFIAKEPFTKPPTGPKPVLLPKATSAVSELRERFNAQQLKLSVQPSLSKPISSAIVGKQQSSAKQPAKEDSFEESMYTANDEYEDVSPIKQQCVKKDNFIERAFWKQSAESGEQLMRNLTVDGAFMVRNSRDLSSQTLLVRTDGMVRKFKIIVNEAGKHALTAETGPWFANVGELATYYMKNQLPNLTYKLTKPYADCK